MCHPVAREYIYGSISVFICPPIAPLKNPFLVYFISSAINSSFKILVIIASAKWLERGTLIALYVTLSC